MGNSKKKLKKVLGVIGLGYVGLPLAIEFVRSDYNTNGFGIDERKTEKSKNDRME